MTFLSKVLLDTSAIVAIFVTNEQNHSLCVKTLAEIQPPLFTTWPVLTEAHYLLRHDRNAQAALLRLAKSSALELIPLDREFIDWFEQFAKRYQDQEIQLADASLVWLAERFESNTVFTLDRRDFSIYRVHRENSSQRFRILPDGTDH